ADTVHIICREESTCLPHRSRQNRGADGLGPLPAPHLPAPRPIAAPPGPPAGTRAHRVPVVMPGLWDCHGHFMGIRATNVEDHAKTSLPVLTARSVADANRALVAGFTSVRDLIGLGIHLARVVDEGTIPGPHIYGGGAML